MLDVNEARKLSDDKNSENYTLEFETIKSDIERRCKDGYYFITYENKNLSTDIIQTLKELGYKINYGQKYNDEYIEINWR